MKALEESIMKVHKQNVEAGFFAEQGTHYSGMTYPQLMFKHEYGTETLPPRPVFRNAANNMVIALDNLKSSKARPVKQAFGSWKKNLAKKSSPNTLLDELGQFTLRELNEIFGNKRYLTVTRNRTPLIKTGALVKHLRYRTSMKTNLRKLK